MNKEDNIKAVFRKISTKDGVSLSDFKKCLVHISIYEAQNGINPGNSRYVFLGMYAFRGYLAGLISKYISGNGKQLQQYLGNVFSNERLAHLFDDLKLEGVVGLHPNLKLENFKHVFAQAYLGFIFQYATEDFLEETTFKYFLKNSDKFLPKVVALNQIQILKAKAEQVLGQKIKFVHSTKQIDGKAMFISQVSLNLDGVIAEHTSVSQIYAKKKAVKMATKYVLDKEALLPEYKEFVSKKLVAEQESQNRLKAEKQKNHLAQLEEKRLKRAAEKEIKRIEAKEREIRRVLNKKGVKNRKEFKSTKEKELELLKEMESMSANKRRRIQDKLK